MRSPWTSASSRLVRTEATFAALAFAMVAAFALVVLLDEDVSTIAFAELAAAYVGVTLLIVGTACLLLAAGAVWKAGRASRWKASPMDAARAAILNKWREDRLLSLAWPAGVFLLLMPSFNAFKQRILPDAGFLYDPELAAIDRAFFGTDPGLWLHDTIGSPVATALLDALYHGWFLPTTLGVAMVGLCAGTRTRAQYMIAYVGVWIILGAVLAFLVPAAGPAFYAALVDPGQAGPFTAVADRLAATSGGGLLTSLHNQQYLIANLDRPALVVGGGISAIPSVHNALAVLFALASFRIGRLCGLAMSAFALMIWIGSVYLNWHYAIDGVVGAVGALLLWFGAGALVDRLMRTGSDAAAPASRPPELIAET
ncbi:phosphatase PAP2 family protein [Sphingosinicella sp. CPCC 101087]|uniref:phosphatase PAP2 family protein n=1 Tax=Sphingosinicella sp. CPCC 101087 TaxID=2497754 RepID=UPI0013EA97D0|nr:phosphatase PAP2 family protein [Sphingosinicella sp. CPCC 101087]